MAFYDRGKGEERGGRGKGKREEEEENENVVSMVSMMHWRIALSVIAPLVVVWSFFGFGPFLWRLSEGLTFIDFKLRDIAIAFFYNLNMLH